jgi:hypothetical protein
MRAGPTREHDALLEVYHRGYAEQIEMTDEEVVLGIPLGPTMGAFA